MNMIDFLVEMGHEVHVINDDGHKVFAKPEADENEPNENNKDEAE